MVKIDDKYIRKRAEDIDSERRERFPNGIRDELREIDRFYELSREACKNDSQRRFGYAA